LLRQSALAAVAGLLAAKSRRPLQTSIGLELVLALLIIVLTATLTTVTGPP
jgi:putative copper export protein